MPSEWQLGLSSGFQSHTQALAHVPTHTHEHHMCMHTHKQEKMYSLIDTISSYGLFLAEIKIRVNLHKMSSNALN